MKRKPPTPLPDISLATWDPFTTNETDVKYVETCNLQKVWDSSDSLNGNSCLL